MVQVWEGRGSQDLGPFTPYAPTRVLGAVRYWHSVYDALCHTSIAYAKPSALAYGAMACASVWCYGVCGTELAYGAGRPGSAGSDDPEGALTPYIDPRP
eukprot:1318735-Rhodomonas_salina.1